VSKTRGMFSQKLRGIKITKLIARDGMECSICGIPMNRKIEAPGRGDAISFDHIIPRSEGGSDRIENLRLAHRACNSIRGVDPVAEGDDQ
jgi:5-methylcytosine-specific restriction endonuclease McrA